MRPRHSHKRLRSNLGRNQLALYLVVVYSKKAHNYLWGIVVQGLKPENQGLKPENRMRFVVLVRCNKGGLVA